MRKLRGEMTHYLKCPEPSCGYKCLRPRTLAIHVSVAHPQVNRLFKRETPKE